MKISQLNALYGGTDAGTTVASVVLCAVGETQSVIISACCDTGLVCDDPPTVTGVTNTVRSRVNCIGGLSDQY